jgi:hypothetical protein
MCLMSSAVISGASNSVAKTLILRQTKLHLKIPLRIVLESFLAT